jgi:hypothetical protein
MSGTRSSSCTEENYVAAECGCITYVEDGMLRTGECDRHRLGRTHLIIVEAADGTSKISAAKWRGNQLIGLGHTDGIRYTSFDELVKNAIRIGGIER